MSETIYDIAIIGGDPADLTIAINGARYDLKMVFSDSFGRTVTLAHKVCNYPGFKEISGMAFTKKIIK